MNESESPTLIIFLASFAGLLALVFLLLLLRISWRLSRMEELIGRSLSRAEPSEQPLSKAETSAGGAFEAFLAEDPSRRDLPKGEQFSTFRQWRHDKGMNWSNS